MAQSQGRLKQLPYPEGLFEKLAQQGAALLNPQDQAKWRTFDSQREFALYTRPAKGGQPALCAGKGTFPFPLEEVVKAMVHNMPSNSPRWDRVCLGVDVVDAWSDQDFLYRYSINPGSILARRDMVYYEAWRQSPDGSVVNVSASMDGPYNAAWPIPEGWVRMSILLHYKRFTPTPDGKTKYETIQQMDLRGWLPHMLTTGGVTKGLRAEFEGFIRIMQEDRKQQAAVTVQAASAPR